MVLGEVSGAQVSQIQSERVRLDGLLWLMHDSLWEGCDGGGEERDARERENMSQLGLGLLLVGQAAGFRFLPGCQGFQRWNPSPRLKYTSQKAAFFFAFLKHL